MRSLLLRAWRSRVTSPRLRVIEGTPDRALQSRYRLLFPGLSFGGGGVEAFVQSLGTAKGGGAGRTGPRQRARKAPYRM